MVTLQIPVFISSLSSLGTQYLHSSPDNTRTFDHLTPMTLFMTRDVVSSLMLLFKADEVAFTLLFYIVKVLFDLISYCILHLPSDILFCLPEVYSFKFLLRKFAGSKFSLFCVCLKMFSFLLDSWEMFFSLGIIFHQIDRLSLVSNAEKSATHSNTFSLEDNLFSLL